LELAQIAGRESQHGQSLEVDSNRSYPSFWAPEEIKLSRTDALGMTMLGSKASLIMT
jgi:hypothetical protein